MVELTQARMLDLAELVYVYLIHSPALLGTGAKKSELKNCVCTQHFSRIERGRNVCSRRRLFCHSTCLSSLLWISLLIQQGSQLYSLLLKMSM